MNTSKILADITNSQNINLPKDTDKDPTVVNLDEKIKKIDAKKNFIIGAGTFSTIAWLFNYPFCSFILWYLGFKLGSLIIISLALVIDVLLVNVYSTTKTDWLLIEFLKTKRVHKGITTFDKIIYFLLNSPQIIQLIFLSLYTHPPIVVLFFRETAYDFSKFNKRDLPVFLISSFISNFYWILVIALGVKFADKFFG